MIPARILCDPNFWPSIAKDSALLRDRIDQRLRVLALRARLAATFERRAS
jgi:hypothetical protein